VSIYKERSVVHEEKANRAIVRGDKDEAIFWFYQSVVLLLEGYLVEHKGLPRSGNHDARRESLSNCPELGYRSKCSKFIPDYKRLKGLSEQIRYDPEYKHTDTSFESSRKLHRRLCGMLKSKY